ncbi:MAG: hypothetical protein R3D29_12255 [Nitratireductor sp.]
MSFGICRSDTAIAQVPAKLNDGTAEQQSSRARSSGFVDSINPAISPVL